MMTWVTCDVNFSEILALNFETLFFTEDEGSTPVYIKTGFWTFLLF